eukprot:766085-Hanusia_phi.AAC.1
MQARVGQEQLHLAVESAYQDRRQPVLLSVEEGAAGDRPLEPVDPLQDLTLRHAPHDEEVVVSSRDEPLAVKGELDPTDPVGVAQQHLGLGQRDGVPELDGLVGAAGRDQRPVGGPGH